MLEHLTPELRHELAAMRVAGLHRSADHSPLGASVPRFARTLRRRAPRSTDALTFARARGT